MTNPYDQFDDPIKTASLEPPDRNPYDQFDEQPAKVPPQPKAGAFLSSKAGRLLQGAAEPVMGLVQGASHLTGYGTESTDAAAQKLANLYQASRREAGLTPQDWDYWAGAGNVVSPINVLPGAAIGRVAGPASTLLGMAGRAASTGAAYGATQPVTDLAPGETYGEKKAEQIGMGAITGGVLGPVAGAAANVISPKLAPGMQQFITEGGEPTAAQAIGGFANKVEAVAAESPIIGSWVKAARERGAQSVDKVSINRALDEIGEKLPSKLPMSQEAINSAGEKFGTAYQNVYSKMAGKFDDQFHQDMAQIAKGASAALPKAQQGQLERIINGAVIDRAGPTGEGALSGDVIHEIGMTLNKEAAGYASDKASFDNRKLGQVLNSAKDAFDAMLERQNPELAGDLQKVNRGWEKLSNVSFTPSADKSTERAISHATLLGHALTSPLTAAAHAAVPIAYSKIGQDFARKALTARPRGSQAISDVLRQYAPIQGTQGYLALSDQEKPQ
jgi:hypothetical protein